MVYTTVEWQIQRHSLVGGKKTVYNRCSGPHQTKILLIWAQFSNHEMSMVLYYDCISILTNGLCSYYTIYKQNQVKEAHQKLNLSLIWAVYQVKQVLPKSMQTRMWRSRTEQAMLPLKTAATIFRNFGHQKSVVNKSKMRCCEWKVNLYHLAHHQSIVICILHRILWTVLNSLCYLPWKNPISKFTKELSFTSLKPLSDKILTWKAYPKTNPIAAPILAFSGVISTCNAPNWNWQPHY